MSTFLREPPPPFELPPLPLLDVRPSVLPEAEPFPEIPYLLDDISAFLDLPPIGRPIEANIPRISDVNAPGHSQPHDQGFALPSVDQTRSVTAATVAWKNSNGEYQSPNPTVGQKGVTVTRDAVAPMHNYDGSFQPRNFGASDQGVTVLQHQGGLPLEAMPDSQNLVRMPKIYAEIVPVSRHVNADAAKQGGVPLNHNIK